MKKNKAEGILPCQVFKDEDAVVKYVKEYGFADIDVIWVENVLIGGATHENVVFTQDDYDIEGRVVSYGNKKRELGLDVVTPNNRYEHDYAHTTVHTYSKGWFRDDVHYNE